MGTKAISHGSQKPGERPGPSSIANNNQLQVKPIVQLVRAHIDTTPANTQIDYSQFNTVEFEQYGNLPPDHVNGLYQIRCRAMLQAALESIRQFAEKIPGFVEINKNDQEIVIQSSVLDLMIMRMAYRNEPNDLKIVCCDGVAFQRNQLYPFLHEWIDEFFEFSNRLHQIVNIDLSSFSCISALALLRPDLEGLEDPEKLDVIRKNCHGWLIENCQTNENVCDRRGYHERVLSVLHFVHTGMTPRLHPKIFLLKQADVLPKAQHLQKAIKNILDNMPATNYDPNFPLVNNNPANNNNVAQIKTEATLQQS